MQAKDIPDDVFLEAVREVMRLRDASWANRWDVGAVLCGHPENVQRDGGPIPDAPPIPHKVVLAKARALIRRGLLDGCTCGCRGDFEPVAPEA